MKRHGSMATALYLLYVFAFVVVSFLLLEGVASTIVASRVTAPSRVVAERLYCEYDPDLGWISKAQVRVEGVYGPNRDVVTNSRRFRNVAETDPKVRAGKARIICSGDSFTFGYGVDNEHAWCQQLSSLDPRIEAVNMGQGGYGFDQSYLWYKRDGASLEHDVQIMAFIAVDFDRMRGSEFNGYGKPVLALEGGRLVTRNTPVPRRGSAVWSEATARLLAVLQNLKLAALIREKLLPGPTAPTAGLARERIPAVVAAVIEELGRVHRERGSILALAFLPTREDYGGTSQKYLLWREPIATAAARQGAIFLDLVAEMSKLPPERIPGLFLNGDGLLYRSAAGHYTDSGNHFVAETLHGLLEREPRFQALLGRVEHDTMKIERGKGTRS